MNDCRQGAFQPSGRAINTEKMGARAMVTKIEHRITKLEKVTPDLRPDIIEIVGLNHDGTTTEPVEFFNFTKQGKKNEEKKTG